MKRFLSPRAALTAAACAGALAAAACASNAPQAGLSGTSWRLESMSGAPAVGPTLDFTEDRISGSGGCNRFFGGYSTDAGRISLTQMGSTRMACADDTMHREDDFLAALNTVQSFRRDGDRLVLSTADGRELVLQRAPLRTPNN